MEEGWGRPAVTPAEDHYKYSLYECGRAETCFVPQ